MADKSTGNSYPAVSKAQGRYYIAKQILRELFGFDVTYDKAKGIVRVTTDSRDVTKAAVDAPATIGTTKAVNITLAGSFSLLDDKGVMADDAQAKWDAYAAAQQTATEKSNRESSKVEFFRL